MGIAKLEPMHTHICQLGMIAKLKSMRKVNDQLVQTPKK